MRATVHVKSHKKQPSVVVRHGEYMMTVVGDGNASEVKQLLAQHLKVTSSMITTLDDTAGNIITFDVVDREQ